MGARLKSDYFRIEIFAMKQRGADVQWAKIRLF